MNISVQCARRYSIDKNAFSVTGKTLLMSSRMHDSQDVLRMEHLKLSDNRSLSSRT